MEVSIREQHAEAAIGDFLYQADRKRKRQEGARYLVGAIRTARPTEAARRRRSTKKTPFYWLRFRLETATAWPFDDFNRAANAC